MPQFRPATTDDFSAICQLVKSEEELFLVYPSGSFPLTVEQLDELSQLRTALTVVVEQGRVVGFANLYNHQPHEFAYIGNVIIDQQCRGRGVGRAMVEYMLAIAVDELGLPEVRISVFADNTPALILYASLGFSPYDIEVRASANGLRSALIHLNMPVG